MQKFNKSFTIGMEVRIEGFGKRWFEVREIHETRNWIKVIGLEGSFQRGHINKFRKK